VRAVSSVGSAATAKNIYTRAAERGKRGVNISVPAPVAYFPFTGWKDSFFGDLHATGRDGVEFYTERKVVIERWQ
jgi:malonate-semialdehyde dehydrogenase (acetylating)/methylmalonate-semialdehyde dehydrogenase